MSSAPAQDFDALFGHPPQVRADAPGRVNLIGEHTDYNGGCVLPMAIPQRTWVELRRRDDRQVRAYSENVGGDGALAQFSLGAEARTGGWLDYVAGVTAMLARAGHALGGFDLRVRSTVPLGSGLSSSAALEVALLRGLRELFALKLDDVELALLGQRVECDFVGAPVGVMDQMASSLADASTALFLDTRTLRYERVPLPEGAELGVINSGVTHSHAGGDYRLRRAECERAAQLLGVQLLCELPLDALRRAEALEPPLGQRARHVLTENARVYAAVDALRGGDLERVGRLFRESHQSMRDDYAVSVPEIDLLVELADTEPEVFGARLTGGGFGGSIVFLARAGCAAEIAARVAARYRTSSGRTPAVLVP